jgi:hypothetical protein
MSLRRLEAAENRVGGLVFTKRQIYDWTYRAYDFERRGKVFCGFQMPFSKYC